MITVNPFWRAAPGSERLPVSAPIAPAFVPAEPTEVAIDQDGGAVRSNGGLTKDHNTKRPPALRSSVRQSDKDHGTNSLLRQRRKASATNHVGHPDGTPEPRLVPTIFHEPWWLEAATDGACQEATVSANNIVVGRLPYLVCKKVGGQKVLVMPAMTHVLGPALAAEITTNESARSLRQFNVTRDLIAQLPKASHTWFRLHRGVTNTLAFEAADFSTGVDFTTEIAPDSQDKLWRQMRDKTRNVIRRAQERLHIVELPDPEQFLDFYEANLHERGKRNNYSRSVCRKLIAECLRRGVGRLLATTDANGNLSSGIFTVWDDQTEFYFMSTRTLDSMNGATSLLIWTAIQHAAMNGLTFNTDGVNSKTSLMLLTGFGGTLKPSYFVYKNSTGYQVTQYVKRLLTTHAAQSWTH